MSRKTKDGQMSTNNNLTANIAAASGTRICDLCLYTINDRSVIVYEDGKEIAIYHYDCAKDLADAFHPQRIEVFEKNKDDGGPFQDMSPEECL